MDLLKKTSDIFTEKLDQVILLEILDVNSNIRLRQIQKFAGDVKPDQLVERWNRQSCHKFKLIGTMKNGDKINVESKEYRFQGIGQLNCSKNIALGPDSSHLKFTNEKGDDYAIDISNKYLTSAFVSNFELNKIGRSITSLRGNEDTKLKGTSPVEIMLGKCESEAVFALNALLEEKMFPFGQPRTKESLLEKDMNVFNLHKLGDAIYNCGLSLTGAMALTKGYKEPEVTKKQKLKAPKV